MPTERAVTYRMVRRRVRVEYDASKGSALLREELSRYPSAAEEEAPDLTVRYRVVDASGRRLVNPRIHAELEDGFVMRERMAKVRFRLDGERLLGVDFLPTAASSVLVKQARRMLDMQFSSREERAGVIFHELALVPAVHWMPDVAVVHASAFSDGEGRVTLIGGTGGVGKTSIALELCMHHGFDFLADDISFVDESGHVWPNLAYPKIYAYNLEDNPELAARVLEGRGAADRLHWMMHRRRGPQFVRRRVAPDVLYGTYDEKGGPLHRYVLLAREERPRIDVSEIAPERAAAMSICLMQPEYHRFHNHLHWHAFNRTVEGRRPAISVRETVARWERQLRNVLENARCLMVRIPLSIGHRAFKREMAAMISHADA